jgi:hypothetical protein
LQFWHVTKSPKTVNRNFYVTALPGRYWQEDAMRQSVVRYVLLIFALVVAVAVAIGVVSGATSNQRQVGGFVAQQPTTQPAKEAPGHRHIFAAAGPGVPITARLEPEDKIVEAIDPSMDLYYSDQVVGAEEELETMLVASAVAVIDVVQKESTFNADETWIRSTLTVQVREVQKDSTGQLVAGNLMQVMENNGEVVLPDGRRIIARHKYVRPSRVGGTYLAALSFYEGRFSLNGLFSFEFNNGKVERMRLHTPPDMGLEQKTSEWATQRARAIAERRPR